MGTGSNPVEDKQAKRAQVNGTKTVKGPGSGGGGVGGGPAVSVTIPIVKLDAVVLDRTTLGDRLTLADGAGVIHVIWRDQILGEVPPRYREYVRAHHVTVGTLAQRDLPALKASFAAT